MEKRKLKDLSSCFHLDSGIVSIEAAISSNERLLLVDDCGTKAPERQLIFFRIIIQFSFFEEWI
jgi:hypothetical protein